MDLADILNIGRTGFFVDFKSTASSADHGFSDGNPGIVMAENTCIFFITWRIGGDFPKVQVVSGISRLLYHDTVFGIQPFFYRIQCFFCKAFLYTDPCHYAESLRLNKDLAFFTFMGTYLLGCCVIGAKEPVTIPAGGKHCLVHGINCIFCLKSFLCVAIFFADGLKFPAVFYKHSCNENRFCHRTFRRTSSLEWLPRLTGKAVQIQAVVPVCTADQRQFMGT